MTGIREQLIKIHRGNYLRNIRNLKDSLGDNAEITQYEKEYLRALRGYREISSKQELLKKAALADIIYHGDYHTLKQSQRSVVRILRDLLGKRKLILCLEMFYAEDQKNLDAYMSGQISEQQLLKKINYHQKWPFEWRHFRPIIKLCVQHQIPVYGINANPPEEKGRLLARDKFSAKIIGKLCIRHSGSLIYVVDGEYHIAPPHLPAQVKKLLAHFDVSLRSLFIYQNAENLYWKLCKQRREEADVLKINDQSFCVMNTMPANKVHSYLNWLAYSEDAYFPVHSNWEDVISSDTSLSVMGMVKNIANVFNIGIPEKAFDRLKIYYSSNLHYLEQLLKTPRFKSFSKQIRIKLQVEEAFMLEYEIESDSAYIIYLPNSNINMASEEATHFLHAICRGPLRFSELPPFKAFYASVMTECIGFLGSKIINEKRKTVTENALRVFLGTLKGKEPDSETAQKGAVARFLLQHLYLQRRGSGKNDFIKKFKDIFILDGRMSRMYSTQLGYYLGNRIYYGLKRETVLPEKISELFFQPLATGDNAFQYFITFSDMVKKIRTVRQY